MSWTVSIRSEAEEDLANAVDWYRVRSPELADRFLAEVAFALRKLEQDPEQKSLYYLNFRRVLLEYFPYKLFYQIAGQRVIVFRVLHAKQCHEPKLD